MRAVLLRWVVAVGIAVVLAGSLGVVYGQMTPMRPAGKSKAPKDVAEAVKWLRSNASWAGGRDIRFNLDTGDVSWSTRSNQVSFNLAMLVQAELIHDAATDEWRVSITNYSGASSSLPQASGREAERVQAALLFLAQQAAQNVDAALAATLESFKPLAAAWRALTSKPAMPDDVYSHKVLAEAAYQEKNLVRADLEYTLALEKFPMWPEGQFNDALIAGELKAYRNAVLHMKEYLLLAPDAPDARAAKDKIIIWQDKLTHP